MAANQQQMQEMVQKALQVFGKFDLPTLQTFYQMAEQALKDPKSYPQMLQKDIQMGKVKQGELPAQYNENVMKSITLAIQIAMKSKQGGGQQQPIQMPQSI